jgi:iron complex outermembrane receptor protein
LLRRRSARKILQDVPISVVAVSAQQAKDAGVTDIRSLTILTPGLTVTSEGDENITTARIRGIGTVGDNPVWNPPSG